MKLKTGLLPLSLFMLAAPLLHAQQDDVEARALKDEMQRSMKDLHLESMDHPYFIAYKIVDTDRKEAQASFGSLAASGQTHNRTLTVTVHVGTYEFDNTNFNGGGGGIAAILTSLIGGYGTLPIDDNYDELRRKIWLATDTSYKKAVEDLSAKKAAQQSRNREDNLPDFSKESPRQESESVGHVDEKLADAERLVRAASAAFRTLPLVQSSEADFTVVNTTEHFLDSEGTSYIRETPQVYFHASASLQNTTGEVFSDSYSASGRSLSDLPGEAELLHQAALVADHLSNRRKGKVAKRYNGPVLVEDQAAVELFAHNFANLLSARRAGGGGGGNALAALLSGGNGASNNAVNMVNKVGSRVLPDFLTVVDNPQLTQSDGHPLFGNYKFDEEGVPSRETVLVKDGILKTLLTSRAPVRGMLTSTGSMRQRGILPGNLFVDASKSSSTEDLKKQLMDLVAARSLEYGYIIRRLANNNALETIRVYPDGHEDTVRDARVAEITPSSFKDILAVSKERTVYTEQAQIGGLAGVSLPGGDLITYVVPNMLFEDMTVEHVPNDSPKLPDISSPLASN